MCSVVSVAAVTNHPATEDTSMDRALRTYCTANARVNRIWHKPRTYISRCVLTKNKLSLLNKGFVTRRRWDFNVVLLNRYFIAKQNHDKLFSHVWKHPLLEKKNFFSLTENNSCLMINGITILLILVLELLQ